MVIHYEEALYQCTFTFTFTVRLDTSIHRMENVLTGVYLIATILLQKKIEERNLTT